MSLSEEKKALRRQRHAERYQNDPAYRERICARGRAYYHRNKERVLARQKVTRRKKPIHAGVLSKRDPRYKVDPEYQRKYEEQQREKARASQRRWYHEVKNDPVRGACLRKRSMRACQRYHTDPAFRAKCLGYTRAWYLRKIKNPEYVEKCRVASRARYAQHMAEKAVLEFSVTVEAISQLGTNL